MRKKMDRNAQRMDEMRDDMQTQRGEKQSMVVNLQASLEEMKDRIADWKMAPARGESTESGGSATVVRTAVETGEVEVKEMRELIGMAELTETQDYEIKAEHTQVEL